MKRELLKIVCQAVVVERDDSGQVTGELTSQPVSCFSPDDLAAFHAKAAVEVADFNASQPNRRQRRSAR